MKDKTEYGNEEVEILKKLQNCDKIIDLVEEYHENYQTILITEYLTGKNDILEKSFTLFSFQGGNLFERLSEPEYHLTEEKCKIFVKQILGGVSFIHNQNIIHLNITPYNIIFKNKVKGCLLSYYTLISFIHIAGFR